MFVNIICGAYEEYIQSKKDALNLYQNLYRTNKAEAIVNYINQLTRLYPFTEESLYGLWVFFWYKLPKLNINHLQTVSNLFQKYMHSYGDSKYTVIVLSSMVDFVNKHLPNSYMDSYMSLLFNLKNAKCNVDRAIENQIIKYINEQNNHLGKIKRLLDVIRDTALQQHKTVMLYAFFVLAYTYARCKLLSLSAKYMGLFLSILNDNPKDTDYQELRHIWVRRLSALPTLNIIVNMMLFLSTPISAHSLAVLVQIKSLNVNSKKSIESRLVALQNSNKG